MTGTLIIDSYIGNVYRLSLIDLDARQEIPSSMNSVIHERDLHNESVLALARKKLSMFIRASHDSHDHAPLSMRPIGPNVIHREFASPVSSLKKYIITNQLTWI